MSKLRNLKLKVFEEADPAALETAVNDWLAARGEEDLVSVRVENPAAGQYDVYIIYTEE